MNSLVDLGTLDGRLAGIQRPSDIRFSSGLCRAVGERLGIDPLVVRIVTVILTLAAGLGLALYFWGTVLTPRVGHEAPVRRLIPAFERWTVKSQVLVIVGSTLVLVITAASTARVPVGPAVILVALVLLAKRRGSRAAPSPQSWAPPSDLHAAEATPSTVEEWRARVASHASVRTVINDPLPLVDLYGPETTPEPDVRPRPARTSWLGAIGIVLLGLTAGVAAADLGLGSDPALMAMATCTVVVGVSMVSWALLVRSRRLPILMVVLVLAGGAVTAGTVVQQGMPYTDTRSPGAETMDGSMTYSFLADGKGLVDLTGLDPESTATIRVEALASNVRILLPGEPREIVLLDSDLSEITEVSPSSTSQPVPIGITLEIEAAMSKITLEYS